MQGLEDKALLRELRKKLEKSLRSAIMCLLYLYQNMSMRGQLYAPLWIARESRTACSKSSELISFPASVLSWMAKCPLARNIMLSSKGSLSYTTPLTVGGLKRKHYEFLKSVDEALKNILAPGVVSMSIVKGFKLEPVEELCVYVNKGDRCYRVCGKPDLMYILYGEKLGRPLALVIEVTLSPVVKHLIRGEMLFYSIASYLSYGCDIVGLVVSRKHFNLVLFKEKALKSFEKLFKGPLEYEEAIKVAEDKRSKHPWMCSLCDLKHMCPLGVEA